jgi:hypothetical protein
MNELCIVGPDYSKPEVAEKKVKLHISWMPLTAAMKQVPSAAGIYFLGAPFNIWYKGGFSRICYIGSSGDLRRRLHTHAKFESKSGNVFVRTIAEQNSEKVLCFYYSCPKLKKSRLEGLEEIVIYEFGLRYGYLPFGNIFPPEGNYEEWEGQVEINEPFVPGEGMDANQIAQRYGLTITTDEYPIMGIKYALLSGKIVYEEKVWRLVFS